MSILCKERIAEGKVAEMTVAFRDNSVYQLICGADDQHLQFLERELDITISRVEGGLRISGIDSEAMLAADLLEQLRQMIEEGEQIFPSDVEYALRILSKDRSLQLRRVLCEQVIIAGKRYSVSAKSLNQKLYIEAIRNHDIVFGIGPAGTGKTYIAMAMALSALVKKEVKRVVLCRPAVEAGEKLGFLPGDMAEKVNPYLRPLHDALHDMVDEERAKELIERGSIEVAPLAFMRGRTLSESFVILDEAQNTSRGQMKMLLTRLGRHSKCVITGDVTQIDLPPGIGSGLVHASRILAGLEGIKIVAFGEEDVIRHPLVAEIVRAYGRNRE